MVSLAGQGYDNNELIEKSGACRRTWYLQVKEPGRRELLAKARKYRKRIVRLIDLTVAYALSPPKAGYTVDKKLKATQALLRTIHGDVADDE